MEESKRKKLSYEEFSVKATPPKAGTVQSEYSSVSSTRPHSTYEAKPKTEELVKKPPVTIVSMREGVTYNYKPNTVESTEFRESLEKSSQRQVPTVRSIK